MCRAASGVACCPPAGVPPASHGGERTIADKRTGQDPMGILLLAQRADQPSPARLDTNPGYLQYNADQGEHDERPPSASAFTRPVATIHLFFRSGGPIVG